jgi:hypothetical protein
VHRNGFILFGFFFLASVFLEQLLGRFLGPRLLLRFVLGSSCLLLLLLSALLLLLLTLALFLLLLLAAFVFLLLFALLIFLFALGFGFSFGLTTGFFFSSSVVALSVLFRETQHVTNCRG